MSFVHERAEKEAVKRVKKNRFSRHFSWAWKKLLPQIKVALDRFNIKNKKTK